MVDRLRALLHGKRVVALTGAGLSTESGIPDYRSPETLARGPVRRPIHGPEFVRSGATRKRYWARSALGWERMRLPAPNAGHRAIATLEHRGAIAHVVTQDEAFAAVDAAEALLVVGSSLAVFSGYRLLRRAVERGIPVAIVNRGPVRGEEHAAVKVDASAGAILHALSAD